MNRVYTAIASSLLVGTFWVGSRSETINELITKSHAHEQEFKNIHDTLYDIHGKVCAIEKDIKYLVSTKK
jgi:hypothetical protein